MSVLTNYCALCGHDTDLALLNVPPRDDRAITLCATCRAGVEGAISDAPHWRCLADAIWSTEAGAQVTAYRLLTRLNSEAWARDLLDIAYLEPENLAWAEAGLAVDDDASEVIHRDTNGAVLAAGDTVTLIKDLNVKGAGFTAKRGTAVRNISLVPDNEGHIEGRVSGQQIVILTEFVKKS
ncbi:PhnA domain-containing protein [Profundibacter sp.]